MTSEIYPQLYLMLLLSIKEISLDSLKSLFMCFCGKEFLILELNLSPSTLKFLWKEEQGISFLFS